jgi:hypothetical protein
MPFVLPALKQVPSPNYSARSGVRIERVIVHDCEGNYQGSISWFAQQRSEVSAHIVLREDGLEATQCVPLNEKAWHACNQNSATIGVEFAGWASKGFSDAELDTGAAIVAWLLLRYGLPLRWAQGGAGEGFCSHWDTGPSGGGHTDITTDPIKWQAFAVRVGKAYAALETAPLVDWGLHGAPAPSSVSLPPPMPAGWVPSGTIRRDAAPTMVAPASSGYPIGSLADIQWRLNRAGAASPPLAVDGLWGTLTESAIKAFQSSHGLNPDGDVGIKTWPLLERAA